MPSEAGISRVGFFLGTCNIAFTAFFLAKFPAYYWVVYTVKAAIYIPGWFFIRIQKGEEWFVMDYCWVHSISMAVYLACSGYGLVPDAWHSTLFAWFWGAAVGAMGPAVLWLSNPLFVHSFHFTATTFIHMIPNMVAWTLRWYVVDITRACPGCFVSAKEIDGLSYWQLYFVPLAAYVLWFLVYTTWLLTHGVTLPAKGKHTVFSYNCETLVGPDGKKLPETIAGYTGVQSTRGQALVYMFGHAAANVIGFLWPLLVIQSFWLHTGFIVATFLKSAWEGSGMMEKLVDSKGTEALLG